MLHATAQPIDGSLRHKLVVAGRHVLYTDEPQDVGGEDTAATPHELLAAALAGCVSTMIVLAARAREWPTQGLHVDVVYDQKDSPRRFTVHVTLPEGLSETQRSRLMRVAHACPVRRALETSAVIEETFTGAHRAA
jgi:putative redox protein